MTDTTTARNGKAKSIAEIFKRASKASEDNPLLDIEREEMFHKWFYDEVDKLDRGEPAQVRREVDNGFWERNVFTLLVPRWMSARARLRLKLQEEGYAPIPVNGKIPPLDGWQKKLDVSHDEIISWDTNPKTSKGKNTGLLAERTPGLDIDILNADAADAVEQMVRDRFEERGCILARIGSPPKRLIPFRNTAAAFEKIQVCLVAPDSTKQQKIEFLGKGQQFVAFGKHPKTHQPYQWSDAGEPGKVKLDELPEISAAEAQQLVEDIVELLVKDFSYQRGKVGAKEGAKEDNRSPYRKFAERNPYSDYDEERGQSAGQQINDAALANMAAWVLEIFPKARPYHEGGYRVSPADRGPGVGCNYCGRQWSEHDEDISFDPKEGICDFAVGDEGDPKEGSRSPIDIVMEHVFGVSPEDLVQRERTDEFEQAVEWLRERLPSDDDKGTEEPDQQPSDDDKGTEEPDPQPKASQWDNIEPIDLWATGKGPALPKGLLPKVIEDLAFEHGALMGVDPAGLAMSALAICGAVIPDCFALQMKRNDPDFRVSARLWVALVGLPSTKKSPVMKKCMKVAMRIHGQLMEKYLRAKAAYDDLSKDEKKDAERPLKNLLWLDDTTYEGAADVMLDSIDGVLVWNEELNGWFGAMDKYGGHRGAAADRGFWLKASYDGGPHPCNRRGTGAVMIPNLGSSLLGGIHPETMRSAVAEGINDGLVQRLNPIMLRQASVGHDDIVSPSLKHYEDLVMALWEMPRERSLLIFTDEALVIRKQLEAKHDELVKDYEHISSKLASHIGKYDGMFGRYCLIWHMIEHHKDILESDVVDVGIARRVAAFMHDFLLPHAEAFYIDMVGFSDDHERVLAVAGFILAHKLDKITNRDVQKGVRSMRRLERREIEDLFDKLHAYGWINYAPGRRFTDPPVGIVNPKVHTLYADIAKQERIRRERARKLIAREAEKIRQKRREQEEG